MHEDGAHYRPRLEESRVVTLGILFCITCIRIVYFNICCIKSNVKTLEP